MLGRRLQILIDERRFQRLQDRARERNVSVAAVIRDLVDTGLPPTDEVRLEAAAAILGADPMPVPDVADLKRELDDLRGRRA